MILKIHIPIPPDQIRLDRCLISLQRNEFETKEKGPRKEEDEVDLDQGLEEPKEVEEMIVREIGIGTEIGKEFGTGKRKDTERETDVEVDLQREEDHAAEVGQEDKGLRI